MIIMFLTLPVTGACLIIHLLIAQIIMINQIIIGKWLGLGLLVARVPRFNLSTVLSSVGGEGSGA